jgi:hypothetical protein
MKPRLILFMVVMISLLLGISCSSDKGPDLKGIWKVTDVKIDFDEQSSTPEMLKQVAEREKQTILEFQNDSMVNIIAGNTTYKAFWVFDKESGVINYRFADMGITMTELGKFSEGNIVAESETPIGKIIVTYQKKE